MGRWRCGATAKRRLVLPWSAGDVGVSLPSTLRIYWMIHSWGCQPQKLLRNQRRKTGCGVFERHGILCLHFHSIPFLFLFLFLCIPLLSILFICLSAGRDLDAYLGQCKRLREGDERLWCVEGGGGGPRSERVRGLRFRGSQIEATNGGVSEVAR